MVRDAKIVFRIGGSFLKGRILKDGPQLCTACTILVIITKAPHPIPPRIRSSEHCLTPVSLKPAHLRSHPRFPLRSTYLLRGYASGFVSRDWEIALVETVSERPRLRLVCHSAEDKVFIYALSPLPPLSFLSSFSFILIASICPRRRLASLVHLHSFVSSLSYIHFLIYILLLPVSYPSFHSSASRSGTFKINALSINNIFEGLSFHQQNAVLNIRSRCSQHRLCPW
jgi:hypothetical protein